MLVKKIAFIVILLCLIPVLNNAQGLWLRLDDAPLSGARGEAVVGTDDALYLVWTRGIDAETEFWEYSTVSQRWRSLTTAGLPSGVFRAGTALAWDGDHTLYVLPGARQEDAERTTFFKFDIQENHWEQLRDTPHPQGSGNALAWDSFSKQLYAFLGSGDKGSAFARFDPGRRRWELLSLHPDWDCTGAGASLTSLGRFGVYALQGRCDADRANGAFALFNPFRIEWQLFPSLPAEEGVGEGGSLLWLGALDQSQSSFIYALAGGARGDGPGSEFYRFRLDANRWERLADIPCPIGFYVGNRLAYVGGALHAWQGSLASERFICGGNALLKFDNS